MSKTQGDEKIQAQGLPFYRRMIEKGLTRLDEVGQAVSDAAKRAFSILGDGARIDISMRVPTLTEEALNLTADEMEQNSIGGDLVLQEWAMISISHPEVNQPPVRLVAGVIVPVNLTGEEEILGLSSAISKQEVPVQMGEVLISLPVWKFTPTRIDLSSSKKSSMTTIAHMKGRVSCILVDRAYSHNVAAMLKMVQDIISADPVAVGTALFGAQPSGVFEDKAKFVVEQFEPKTGFYDARYSPRNPAREEQHSVRPELASNERIAHFRPRFNKFSLPAPRAGKTSRAKIGDLNPKGGFTVAYGLSKTGLADHYALTYGVSICSENDLFNRKAGFNLAVQRLRQVDLAPLSKAEVEHVMSSKNNKTRSFVWCYSTMDNDGEAVPHFEGYGLMIIQLPPELVLQRSDGLVELKGPAYPNQMSLAYLVAFAVSEQAEEEGHFQVANMISNFLEPFANELDDDFHTAVFPQGIDQPVCLTYKFMEDVLAKNKDGRPGKDQVKAAEQPVQ